jgi:hypothetical protein
MASVADILSRLGQLHAHGFLTDEEFTEQKDAFLSASDADELTPESMGAADGELGELEKLAELCRAHVLTREEFVLQKRAILQTGTSNVVRDFRYEADIDATSRTSPLPVGWEFLPSDAVTVLWLVTVVLLAGAAWFAFRGTSVTENAWVSPSIVRTAPVTFACSTVWDGWIAKHAYTAGDGTTYGSLTGSRTPDEKIYEYDDVLTSANAACLNANHGRVHLFWTLIVLAALALIGSEVVRNRASRAKYREDEAPTSS